MSLSPRKLISNFSVNKGVEASEYHTENPRIGSGRVPKATWSAEAGSGAVVAPVASDQSASFVQVVVQKARRASSPARPSSPPHHTAHSTQQHAGGTGCGAPPAALLLACPALAALHRHSWDKTRPLAVHASGGRGGFDRPSYETAIQSDEKSSKLKKANDIETHNLDLAEEAERVEVYRFERGTAVLLARGAGSARRTRVGRMARRAGRPANALLAELLAFARLFVAVPVHVALQIEKCVLESVRATLTGAVQTASDQLVKPALALLFNALLQPPLVCAAQTGAAMRAAARPWSAALGDALAAAARPLASLRLVHVEHRV